MKRKKARPRPRTTAELVDDAGKLYESGALAEAEATYRRALAQEPDDPGLLNLLAVVRGDLGDPEASITLIERAIEIAPGIAASHLNLGTAYAMTGADELAVAAMETAAKLDPGSTAPLERLAKHHINHNRPREARALLRRVIRRDPANEAARFLLAGLTGERVEATPAGFVTELFDSYAERFEDHLLTDLDYRVPDELAALVREAGHRPERTWHVLDLGCGTGLSGVAFRDHARVLVGSDLSTRMIEVAAKRAVYDELHAEDLLVTLGRADASVDLIVAADVLVYVGALEALFVACAAALRSGGWFTFSTESHDGEGVKLLPTLRYAHADAYIRELAGRAGFAIAGSREAVLRSDHGKPIIGALYLLRRG